MGFIESQVADTYVDKMRKKKPLVDLVPYASRFYKWFGKVAEVEVTSNNDLKIPVRVGSGAAVAYADFDQGTAGEGGAPSFKKMLSAPRQIQAISQLSLAGMKHTDSQEKAAENLFTYALADHAKRLASTFDSCLLSPAGVFATVTTGTTGTSLVVSDVRHFYEGMRLSRYANDMLTQRTSTSGNDPRVTAVNRLTKTITLNEGFTGGTPATGDLLLLGGLSGASPSLLLSIYDFHVNAASGTVGGLSRATYDQLRSAKASAGSMLNVLHGYAALFALGQKRPEMLDLPKEGVWIGSAGAFSGNAIDVTQRQQIVFNVKQDEGTGARKPTDYSFNILSDGSFCGIPTMLCAHAKDDRIELVLKKNWGKQVTIEPQPIDWGGNGRMFPVIGADYTPKYQYLFGNIAEFQIYCVDPGSEVYIDNIALAAGWSALA